MRFECERGEIIEVGPSGYGYTSAYVCSHCDKYMCIDRGDGRLQPTTKEVTQGKVTPQKNSVDNISK